jgi:hypothetical protein
LPRPGLLPLEGSAHDPWERCCCSGAGWEMNPEFRRSGLGHSHLTDIGSTMAELLRAARKVRMAEETGGRAESGAGRGREGRAEHAANLKGPHH